MSLDTATKKQIIAEYGAKEGDTGSPEVQVALLSQAHQRPHRAPQGAQARPPQPSWPAAARRPAPPPAELPAEEGHQPLPLAHRAARPAPIAAVGSDARAAPAALVRRSRVDQAAPRRTTEHRPHVRTQAHRRDAWPRSSVVAPGPGGSRERADPAGFDRRPACLHRPDATRSDALAATHPRETDDKEGTRGGSRDPHRRGRHRQRHVRHPHHPVRDRPAGPPGRRLRRRLPRRRDDAAVGHHRRQAPQGPLRLLPPHGRRRGADVRRGPDPRLVLPPRGPSRPRTRSSPAG